MEATFGGERAFSIEEAFRDALRELREASELSPEQRDQFRDELVLRLSDLPLRKVLDEEFDRQNQNLPLLGGLYEQIKRRLGRGDHAPGARAEG